MDKIEEKIIANIDAHREEIIALGRDIFAHAELGYKEFRTSEVFCKHMAGFGINVEKNLAITGAKGYLKEKGSSGPTVALVGELDALPIKDSLYTNKKTGASHACGHNAQMAAMMGSVYGLWDDEVKAAIEGNVAFFAVPAEEFVEVEFRNQLKEEGKIHYGGGKCELIRVGAFDDIDIVVGHHVVANGDLCIANNRSNGFVNKIIRFKGKASHAAGAPSKGIDALNAASLAIQALSMQQEGYRDEDTVRVHGFISNGGEAMNIIADKTVMEYSVRANNIPAMENANEKFDRSIRAAALATGCGAEIITLPGYLPTVPATNLRALEETMEIFNKKYKEIFLPTDFISGGSTDFGDVSEIKPVLQFNTGGYSGVLHSKDNHPIDEEIAYVLPAKIFALIAYKLLKKQGAYAKEITDNFTAALTKEEYIEYMDKHQTIEEVPMIPLKHEIE